MRTKLLLSILLTLLPVVASLAQAVSMDAELKSLTDIVKNMRNGGNAYNWAVEHLAADMKWTQMDETNVKKTSLRKWNEKMFGLNKAMRQVYSKRKGSYTHGDMRDGMDPRYNYSLYELVLKSQSQVTFSLPKRSGKQTFVVVPYAGKAAGITASIASATGTGTATDGTITIACTAPRDGTVKITIKNSSAADQSFVLLNYNSRQ